jgi:hypothetical protein
LSSCAWINSSFALTFTYLCNIPYMKRNIVKENKSYVRICTSLEVGSKPLHPYSLESLTFIPFIAILSYIIISTAFKSNNVGCTLPLKPLKANSHIPCRSPAMSYRVNSHMPCRGPASLRQCRIPRESPRGRRKYPNC